jgi:hypothetical protein
VEGIQDDRDGVYLMLVSSYPWAPKKGPLLGNPTTSFNAASASARVVSGLPVLGPDLLVLGWGKVNLTSNPPVTAKFFMGTTNAGAVFTNDVWVGPWGATGRSTFAVWHFRNPPLDPAQSINYEVYNAAGALAGVLSDFTLCILDLHDWSGGIGAEAHNQLTATATSVAQSITPTKNNSLLIGVAGFEDNNAHPLSPSAGWDTLAILTTGTGGALTDGAVGFFVQRNSDTSAKTLTVSTAGAFSAPAGFVGLLELF